MKKYLFLFLTIFFMIPKNTFAWTGNYWGQETGFVYDTYFRLCGGSNCATTLSNQRWNGYLTSNMNETRGFITSTNFSYNGHVQVANVLGNKFKTDYLYSVTQYLCYTGNLSFGYPLGSYLGYSANDIENQIYSAEVLTNYSQTGLSNNPFYGYVGNTSTSIEELVTYNKCEATQFIIKSTNNGNTISIKYPSSGTGQVSVIGADIVALGSSKNLTQEQLQSVINNSGLASARDVEEVQQSVNQVKQEMSDLNDNITSTDTTNSQNQASSFFEGFDTNDYGLSDIVTMPLELIRGLTSNSCVSLSLTLPFVNKTFELPCMSSIYREYFGSFYDLYQLVTFGFISYWVIVRIFNLVKDFKNPDHDEIEVLDL